MKPVATHIHVIPLEDRSDLLHCGQQCCWCSPISDKEDSRLLIHRSMTTASEGWVKIAENRAVAAQYTHADISPPSNAERESLARTLRQMGYEPQAINEILGLQDQAMLPSGLPAISDPITRNPLKSDVHADFTGPQVGIEESLAIPLPLSLVDRVAKSINPLIPTARFADTFNAETEARAAIRAVAAWLAQNGWGEVADVLMRQANR